METQETLNMTTYVARQPIFDSKLKVHAYELLFRSGVENVIGEVDGDLATSSVISDSFFSIGIQTLTGGKRAFINFTQDTLVADFVSILPRETLVVEILENVSPEPVVLEALDRLKKAGYYLALDDYNGENLDNPLIPYVKIVKVDFQQTTPEVQEAIARHLKPKGLVLLAEKVESHEEYKKAKDMGYSLFQGNFFCKPSMVERDRLPETKMSKIRLMHEVNQGDIDFNKVEEIVKHDVSMSYKLLRYINSAYFGLRAETTSIKQALVFLGVRNLKKWASLMAFACLGEDKPQELLTVAVVRARFCELLAGHVGLERRSDDLFLMGLFSAIDAMLNIPIDKVVEEINLAPEIKSALLGEEGVFRHVFDLVLGFEKGEWDEMKKMKELYNLDELAVPQLYFDAVKTAWEILAIESH